MFEDGNEPPMALEDIATGYCTQVWFALAKAQLLRKTFDYEAVAPSTLQGFPLGSSETMKSSGSHPLKTQAK